MYVCDDVCNRHIHVNIPDAYTHQKNSRILPRLNYICMHACMIHRHACMYKTQTHIRTRIHIWLVQLPKAETSYHINYVCMHMCTTHIHSAMLILSALDTNSETDQFDVK